VTEPLAPSNHCFVVLSISDAYYISFSFFLSYYCIVLYIYILFFLREREREHAPRIHYNTIDRMYFMDENSLQRPRSHVSSHVSADSLATQPT